MPLIPLSCQSVPHQCGGRIHWGRQMCKLVYSIASTGRLLSLLHCNVVLSMCKDLCTACKCKAVLQQRMAFDTRSSDSHDMLLLNDIMVQSIWHLSYLILYVLHSASCYQGYEAKRMRQMYVTLCKVRHDSNTSTPEEQHKTRQSWFARDWSQAV